MNTAQSPTPPAGDAVESPDQPLLPTIPHEKEPLISPERVRMFTDKALRFLSTANNETLGACAVGLCATTYLVLGRVGLVLIGVVGGVVLHATWDGSGGEDAAGPEKTAARKRDLALEITKRVLDWRETNKDPEKEQETHIKVEGSVAPKPLDYADFRPATGAALTTLTDAIIRDYVKYVFGTVAGGCRVLTHTDGGMDPFCPLKRAFRLRRDRS